MSDNFYNVLGINEKASKDEIKKAYRGMQMKWHPDKNPGSQEAINMTQKINEAYETLGDEQKRSEYDDVRNNPNPFMRMSHSEMPMDDLFSMFFGGPGNPFGGFPGMPQGMPSGARIHVFGGPGGPMGFQQAMQKPTPILKTLYVNMEQVLTGATIPLDIERWVIENGIKVHEPEIVYVSVPQGIDDGEIIVLRDKGNIISENQKGDVKVFIKINNDTNFKRAGLDLILEKKITLKEALCGFSFEIRYINGKSYTLNNNKGNIIPPEYKKVYPNMGLTRENHKGNMVIHFHVEFPETLTQEQIEKLSEVL
jgi:DnaJ-class molecular chaperone